MSSHLSGMIITNHLKRHSQHHFLVSNFDDQIEHLKLKSGAGHGLALG